ncbi:DUF2971 domain-containing protein [Vibrio splendidus]|uniref:DUF2971 domain-containing protein n=1 Tax=Vibrio splendidus TaxID=29497 RepID=UPI00080DD0B5|nr:DUF2971 domain-containing protein [Vibrio splendidus]OCH61886.1 hypothetical protein A6D94_17075 [Vibrio splendidus]
MKLYKFRQVDTYSLAGLANNTLWFSNLNDFNDPFEGSYIFDDSLTESDFSELEARLAKRTDVSEEAFQEMLKELGITDGGADKRNLIHKMAVRDYQSIVGIMHASKVLSTSYFDNSEKPDPLFSNLMWSHYANGLRGFCLVFDDELLLQSAVDGGVGLRPILVRYTDDPRSLSLSDFVHSTYVLGNKSDVNLIEEVAQTVATKSQAWEYENECRLLSLEKNSAQAYDSKSLMEIVIGEKMPKDQQTLVINTAKSANPDIKIKLARLKENTYQLEVVDYESC